MRLALVSLFFLLLTLGCSKPEQPSPNGKLQKVSFSVEGMVCTSCEQSIQTKLAKLDGVRSVEASTAKKCAVVEFDASKVSEQELIATIESLGYKATCVAESH
ncbi:MAG: heavy-metal-associated domain-containing protein [Chloroherpetonaceae bacterium]|nr:cation transporter [Chloroherpetonaceae bacterium]MCS7210308.1 cation transporter [Chloroherpetonaceae bacterium]MDW8019445.1 heavy-metal-associated domain-containing protein [Chloroherpetonaceae bacterium]MDW8466023.1 heavy-metal-associated domain-containing protein [Chloroherpetonaceae bacterium]